VLGQFDDRVAFVKGDREFELPLPVATYIFPARRRNRRLCPKWPFPLGRYLVADQRSPALLGHADDVAVVLAAVTVEPPNST